jgi:hypothetical protein
MSWEAISPDLTRNDKAKQEPSGGPITLDITSVEYFDTIFAVTESPKQADQIWIGTDDGLVQLTRDGGKTWANVTPKAMPEWSMVSEIDASPFDAGTAYVAVDRHKNDDLRPYIFKTTDFGKTWTSIASNLPNTYYVHAVREDRVRKGLLFAGTEKGIFVSWDDGARWQPLQLNLPSTPVTDMEIHGDDLVIATNGRAFWILDDITPLRQLNAEIAASDVHLFQPQTATRLHLPEQVDTRQPVGQNPPAGAIVDYYLKSKPKDKEEITLDILDASGQPVRHYSNREKKIAEQPPEWPDQVKHAEVIPAEEGLNRFTWDLRYEPPVKIPGAFYSGNGPQGPLAMPGRYQVRITANGKSQTQPLELRPDPRLKNVTADDFRKEFDLGVKIREANNRLHIAVNQIRQLRAELVTLKAWSHDNPQAKAVIDAANALDQKMTPVEEQLIQVKMKSSEGNLRYPNMLNEQFDSLMHTEDAGDSAPTQSTIAVFELLNKQLETQLTSWQQILNTDLPALNQLMRTNGVPSLEAPKGTGE